MSDYKIYNVTSYGVHSVDLKFESVSDGTFTLIEEETPSVNFAPINLYDVVKVTVSQNGVNKSIFGVFQDQTYDGMDYRLICGFDSNVYGGLAEANTDVIKLEYFQLPTSHILELNNYNLAPNFTVATYGKEYKAYNYTERYSIIAPQERMPYDSDLKQLYNNYNDKVLVDTCSEKVYKVSPTELSAVAVAGKIKTALNFNVVIK
jgi:hypothetical protein